MRDMPAILHGWSLLIGLFPLIVVGMVQAGEPEAIKPFGDSASVREDAVPGVVILSDESEHRGLIYLTRDKRLQIFDDKVRRQREIPLSAVKKIECKVKQERLEKEWRFKEGASNEKLYTGRSYPMRECLYTITLKNDETITGPLSTIVYVQPNQKAGDAEGMPSLPERFLLNKRTKGEPGQSLKQLIYVKKIVLGPCT